MLVKALEAAKDQLELLNFDDPEGFLTVDDYSVFFFSSRRRHTRFDCDWSSDVCSSDLLCSHGQCSAGALEGDGALRVVDGPGIHPRRRRSRPAGARSSFGGRNRKILRSEEHTSELQSQSNLVCRLLLENKDAARSLLAY